MLRFQARRSRILFEGPRFWPFRARREEGGFEIDVEGIEIDVLLNKKGPPQKRDQQRDQKHGQKLRSNQDGDFNRQESMSINSNNVW